MKWIKQALVIAGLVLIGHQSVLVPHALCQSLKESGGESIEIVSDSSQDAQGQHQGQCNHDESLAAAPDHHHHDHCAHLIPKSDLSNPSNPSEFLVASTPAFWTVPTPVMIHEPAVLLASANLNCTVFSATEHFVQHVRILS